ncbi:hypothetical protein [Streptomyces sp. NPDC059828]|uniref:hypothetical protein n=1 Tax=Streptomyces sp. NPDC059828 TaxID=3346965 RepID=UPI00365721A5
MTDPARMRTQLRIQALSELVSYAANADRVMYKDRAEWFRNLIRATMEISDEAKKLETELSARAVQEKVLTVTEVATAAKISRQAVYARAEVQYPDGMPE